MGNLSCQICPVQMHQEPQPGEFLTQEIDLKIKSKEIAFTGPRESGKSSLIYYLKNQLVKQEYNKSPEIENIQIQFRDNTYDIKELSLKFADSIKPDAWVYVLDQQQFISFQEFNKFLRNVDARIPVLLFLNKTDLSQDSLDVSEIV